MKKCFLLLFIAGTSFCIKAQTNESNTSSLHSGEELYPSVDDSELFIPESWESNLDSLMNSWYVKHYTHKRENPGYENVLPGNDSIYVSRLSKLNNLVELPYNRIVRNCINLYVERRRSSIEYVLGLESFYFPMIEQALDQYGLPDELKYLAIVESALNPTALSIAGASGLWQFMLPTGKQYGLEINSLVDERCDPLKATHAACQYFKNMYNVFHDWTLVIAAYNCGEGNVNKAIRRANGSTDYWKIYPYLPKETRTYVPLFVAVNYVMNYYAQHQLYPVQTDLPPSTDTVMINRQLHFDQIAEVLEIEKEFLRALNPQYKRDIIPGNSKPRALKLPALKIYAFIELQDSIAKHRADELFTNRTYAGESPRTNEKIHHQVKKGESVVTIANKYGVTTASVRKWNRLRSNKVAAGRRLVIYADNGGYTIASSAKSQQSKSAAKPFGAYKVKKGDTLSAVAKKFNCTSSELKQLNKMGNNILKEGEYIRIPLKE
ncbi:MAG: transglycosylase SLT domain-containing protein [Dysgonamonadaceae bacterium]|jgi:membrane-bound lytic murein transglycosylase D|nr:transglycosylase SLT domain-containing protein [Dysgonamonadaceae bacterium]